MYGNTARDLDEKLAEATSSQLFESYFHKIDDKNLTEHAQACANEYRESMRHAVMDQGRIEILIEKILGYTLKPFHARLLLGQDMAVRIGEYYWAMLLGFRGSGKSTITTVSRVIYEILRNPDIRILIASNTNLQAEVFLRDIKAHIDTNPIFRQIFGEWKGEKWGGSEIIVNQRKRIFKESTVTCLGVGGPTASRHYDLIIADDLVDEENSRTPMQRARLKTWFFKTLLPTLEPGGRLWISGTRWNPDDLYNAIEQSTPTLKTTVVQAIQEDGTTPWPEKFPLEHLLALRTQMGVPEFESQYQMNTKAMQGKIFSYEMFHFYEHLPENLRHFQGNDLAISLKNSADYFAHADIGMDPASSKKYVVDIFQLRLTFAQQTQQILTSYYKHDPILSGIEANAYQAAQVQTVVAADKTVRVRPVFTQKDKVTRAMKLSARMAAGEILFHRSQVDLIEMLLKFPDCAHDDMFDALDIAVTMATQGVRKRRDHEPGVL